MKRNKVVLVLFYVLASAVIVGALALTVYEFAVTREGTASTAIRAGVIVVGMGAAIYRVATLSGGGGARQNIATYRASYGEFIGNAFEGDFRREKLFFSAVGDYQVDSFRSAIRKLERLRPSCKRPNEIFAVRFFIALCYDDMGAYPLAIANYESILTTRKNSRVLSNLGMCYQHIGDDAAARSRYEQAIECDPGNPYPYNNMAHLLLRRGEYAESLDFANRAAAIDSNLCPAYSAQAISLAMLGDDEGSRAALNRLVLHGGNAEAARDMISRLKENTEE